MGLGANLPRMAGACDNIDWITRPPPATRRQPDARIRRPPPALLDPLPLRLGAGGDPRPRPLRALGGVGGILAGPGAAGERGGARAEQPVLGHLRLRHRPHLPGPRRLGGLPGRRRRGRALRGGPGPPRRPARLAGRALARGARPQGAGQRDRLPRLPRAGVARQHVRGPRRFGPTGASTPPGSPTTPSSSSLHDDVQGGRSWQEWPEALASRDPEALAEARASLSERILYRSWLQWHLDEQWQEARRAVVAAGRRPHGRPALHGGHRLGRRLVPTLRLPARRPGRRPARCLQRRRPGLGTPRLPLGRDGEERLRLDRGPGPPLRRALRRLPRRPRGRLLPELLPSQRRGPSGLRPRHRAGADPERRAGDGRLLEGRPGHRRGPGRRPRLRAGLARPARRSLATACFAGRRTRRSSAIRRKWPAVSLATTGTHDTDSMADWWETLPAAERKALLAAARPGVDRRTGARRLRRRGARRAPRPRLGAPAPTSCSCPSRTRWARGSGSTSRAPSTRRTGRTGCRALLSALLADKATDGAALRAGPTDREAPGGRGMSSRRLPGSPRRGRGRRARTPTAGSRRPGRTVVRRAAADAGPEARREAGAREPLPQGARDRRTCSARATGAAAEPCRRPRLRPRRRARSCSRWRGRRGRGPLLVGHNPEVAEAIAIAAGKRSAGAPGTVAALDLSGPAPRLLWVRSP